MRRFPPERIVCLTEETVETLYLLGAEDRIVGRVAKVVEISEGGVGSEGLAKEEPTPWTKLRQPLRRRH